MKLQSLLYPINTVIDMAMYTATTSAINSYQGWKWITPVEPVDSLIHRVIWMWHIYDSLVSHMLKLPFKNNAKWHVKIVIWTRSQISLFFAEYRTDPCTNLRTESLNTTCFRTTLDSKPISHQWQLSVFSRPKVHSISYILHPNAIIVSNEHVIY